MDSNANVLQWRVHPARERLTAALCALLVIALAAALCGILMQNLWWSLLAIAFQVIALRRFFLPSEYRVDADGVTARTIWARQQLRWHEVRRFLCDARGAFLSTRTQGSVLDLFRGMHLVFGKNRDAVIDQIRSRIDRETDA